MAGIMPFRDPALPIERRVEDLLGRMTLEEKVGQLMQYDGRQDGVAELAAAGKVGSILCVLGEAQVTAPAKAALGSRLGIPLLVGIDAIHGHSSWYNATIFPTQLALSHSWDEGICERVARATAVEMGSTGAHWNFAPLFCLPRDLRWGRTGETSGEDGLLIGRLGAAMVRGLQGDDLRRRDCVAACAKHYAGYGESEGGRDASESDHSRRKLRWLFLPPFREAVKAGCTTFMTAYHAIDGVPAAYHRWLLTDVLRGEWGFDGMVVTDWDIVGRKVRDRRIAATYEESSARTLNAGNDLIMTTPQFYDATLANLNSGTVSLAAVDQAVRRVLALKFRLGLFEDPRLPDDRAAAAAVATPAHRQLALESARASLVLLRNRNGL
ncbi:MAG: beta-glucosidase, partial [Planctomycetes bacterium]|nr:beta-glucosidase [Planctomycetota bacterium]